MVTTQNTLIILELTESKLNAIYRLSTIAGGPTQHLPSETTAQHCAGTSQGTAHRVYHAPGRGTGSDKVTEGRGLKIMRDVTYFVFYHAYERF